MGNCDSKICDSDDLKVDADPDVAGIGVRSNRSQALIMDDQMPNNQNRF